MIETGDAIRARIDADWLDEGREIVKRERELDGARDSLAWQMGDWAVDRETSYGDMVRLAAELDIPVGTLKNRASVARRIEPSRRRDDLSWSHHAEVAKLDPGEAEATLSEAALYSWSVDRLRGVLHERGATRAAERQVEALKAQVEALKASNAAPDEARGVIEYTRAEIEAGSRMMLEGCRRILAAVTREDLGRAAGTLHGNARRRLGPSLEARMDGIIDRTEPLFEQIEKAFDALSGSPADRHDAGTVESVPDPADRHDAVTVGRDDGAEPAPGETDRRAAGS